MPERVKISPLEANDVELGCQLLYGNENGSQSITWKWLYTNNSTFVQETNRISITNSVSATRINFNEVKLSEKGVYECQAYNQYGMASQRIFLNVKGRLRKVILIFMLA